MMHFIGVIVVFIKRKIKILDVVFSHGKIKESGKGMKIIFE